MNSFANSKRFTSLLQFLKKFLNGTLQREVIVKFLTSPTEYKRWENCLGIFGTDSLGR